MVYVSRFDCVEPFGVLASLPMTKSDKSKIIKRFLPSVGMTLRVCKKGREKECGGFAAALLLPTLRFRAGGHVDRRETSLATITG